MPINDTLATIGNTAIGTLGSIFTNGLSSLFQRQQVKMQKELMKFQQELNKENMKLEDQYNRAMHHDSALIQKSGLLAAGLSPSSMESGFSPAQSTAQSQSTLGTVSMPTASPLDLLAYKEQSARIQNIEANTKNQEANTAKTEKETSWLDDINDANVSKTIAETQNAKQQLHNLRQSLSESISKMKLNNAEVDEVKARIDKFVSETEGIKINNMYLQEMNEAKLSEIMANAKKALAESDYTKVRKELARMGIGVSNNWVESLVALSHFGQAGVAIKDVKRGLEDVLEALGESIDEAKNSEQPVASALGKWIGRGLSWFISLF